MKISTLILTAAALTALAAPAGYGATTQIPLDSTSTVRGKTAAPQTRSVQQKRKQQVKHDAHVTVGSYNPQAYVPGASSPQVSKAITDAGRR